MDSREGSLFKTSCNGGSHMNSIVESKLTSYLINKLDVKHHQAQRLVTHVENQARIAGFELDERFARAGMAAGPECRVASGILDRALGGGGAETSEYSMRSQVRDWLLITDGRWT